MERDTTQKQKTKKSMASQEWGSVPYLFSFVSDISKREMLTRLERMSRLRHNVSDKDGAW
jgi:hypothetical protein